MIVPIKVKDEDDYIKKCTSLWAKFLELTGKEKDLYYILMKKYIEMANDGVKEPYISKIIFGTDVMKELRSSMDITHQNFNNLKMGLKKKRVILEKDSEYIINPAIVVEKEITFKFIK